MTEGTPYGTFPTVWECAGCSMSIIPYNFDRCPSCWKDRPMPKISATSGPSNADEPIQVPPDAEITEESSEPGASSTAENDDKSLPPVVTPVTKSAPVAAVTKPVVPSVTPAVVPVVPVVPVVVATPAQVSASTKPAVTGEAK